MYFYRVKNKDCYYYHYYYIIIIIIIIKPDGFLKTIRNLKVADVLNPNI